VQIGIIKHELPPEKMREFRCPLCFADIVYDRGKNHQKSTQKAPIGTDIVAKYFCEEAPFTYLSWNANKSAL
jgi:hypothetical protein